MQPDEVLPQLGGAAPRARLLAAGVTDRELYAAVCTGRVLRTSRGTYRLPYAEHDLATAAELGGRLTCSSAAVRHGLDVLSAPSRPHVAVPVTSSRTHDGAVVHRKRRRAGPGLLVPVVWAVVDSLRCLPPPQALVIVDSALRARRVSVAAVQRRLQGPGSVRAKQILRLADPRCGSVPETLVRAALVLAGLPVRSQVRIDGVGRVDFLVDGWLVVEIDGFAFHADRAQYREDRRRTNELVARGYVVLRFSWEDVMCRLDELVATVRSVHAGR